MRDRIGPPFSVTMDDLRRQVFEPLLARDARDEDGRVFSRRWRPPAACATLRGTVDSLTLSGGVTAI